MKLAPQSLRWRLQAWYGLLLLIVLCAFGFTALHLEKAERLRSLDSDLQRRLSALVNALRATPGRPPEDRPRQPPPPNVSFTPEVRALFGPDTGYYYVIWMRGPEPLARTENSPTDLPKPQPGDDVFRTRMEHLRETFLFAAPADCVLVGRSAAEDEARLMSHAWWLAGAGIILLVLGIAGGAWLVTRTLRPVQKISHTAARIAAGDLAQRIPTTATTDSELDQLVRVLNSTFARLEAAFSQQSRFTADAAHELRTPVTVLLSETQTILARERSEADYRESLEVCQRAAQRMRRLIEILLDLAHIEFGHEALQHQECDLSIIAAECLGALAPLARQGQLTTDADLSPAPVSGDPDRLAQVITNLLSNAIQHTHEGGSILIRTSVDHHHASLTVTDTGRGIAPDDLPHIFERFYRADPSRTGASGHAGLGLSIAKAIVAAHGGSITVQSELQRGTTFTILLPRHG